MPGPEEQEKKIKHVSIGGGAATIGGTPVVTR
jgi:hypothetical protein